MLSVFFSLVLFSFLSKFTCRDLGNCFLHLKSNNPGFPCEDTRRLAPRITANQLATSLIDTQLWQINPLLPFSQQPVTWPQCVHIIWGAARLGWPETNPQKFDSFRWDERLGAPSLIASVSWFSRSTTHCEPGVVTVKKQPLEVQPFRQHEQKEKGLEDWKR